MSTMSAAPSPHRIRVVIADDHRGIRSALAQLLGCTQDIEVIGFAADGTEAVAVVGSLEPDVTLMDIGMPVLDGIEATRRIMGTNPAARIVTLTAFRDRREEALQAGAAAHVLKDAPPEELISCIRAVAAA